MWSSPPDQPPYMGPNINISNGAHLRIAFASLTHACLSAIIYAFQQLYIFLLSNRQNIVKVATCKLRSVTFHVIGGFIQAWKEVTQDHMLICSFETVVLWEFNSAVIRCLSMISEISDALSAPMYSLRRQSFHWRTVRSVQLISCSPRWVNWRMRWRTWSRRCPTSTWTTWLLKPSWRLAGRWRDNNRRRLSTWKSS